jgi:hypothetical protein
LNGQHVYIDSHNRTNGTHDNFNVVINLNNQDIDSVCLLRAIIKKTYYLVNNGQNTFILKEGAQTATITLPEGNYSATSFKNVLQTLLNNSSPNGFIYTVSLPNPINQPSTGKFTYTVSNNAGVQPEFIMTTHLYEQLGFEENSTVQFANDILTSLYIVNFQLKDTLRIHSNIVNDQQDNILQEITASTSQDFSSIRYECFDIEANSKPFNIKTNNFNFVILDEEKQRINLSLNVLYHLFFYKKNNSADIANNISVPYMKYMTLQNTPKSIVKKPENKPENKEK